MPNAEAVLCFDECVTAIRGVNVTAPARQNAAAGFGAVLHPLLEETKVLQTIPVRRGRLDNPVDVFQPDADDSMVIRHRGRRRAIHLQSLAACRHIISVGLSICSPIYSTKLSMQQGFASAIVCLCMKKNKNQHTYICNVYI